MNSLNNTIYFYGQKEWQEYYFLSNFYSAEIEINNLKWPTTEHYFQAMKFFPHREDLIEQVRKADTPGKAAKKGRNKNLPLRNDWEKVKEDIMETALLAKFTQHKDLKEKLLATGNKYLVERTNKDYIWGDGGNGTGQNKLGKVLVKVREKIRNLEESANNII